MQNSDTGLPSHANRSTSDYIAALSLLELSSSPRNSSDDYTSQQYSVQDVMRVFYLSKYSALFITIIFIYLDLEISQGSMKMRPRTYMQKFSRIN